MTTAGLLRYGAFGLPLAFVALPLYVILPDWYAREFGVPLAVLGAVLLGSRLADALADPLLGIWIDRLRRRHGVLRPVLLALPLLAVGCIALFNVPLTLAGAAGNPGGAGTDRSAVLGWLLGALLLTYLGYSLATIAYQAWGAALQDHDAGRARVTAAREGCGIAGVILAALLPQLIGMPATSFVFAALLLAAYALLRSAPRPPDDGPDRQREGTQDGASEQAAALMQHSTQAHRQTSAQITRPVRIEDAAPDSVPPQPAPPAMTPAAPWHLPLRDRAFLRLLAVFVCNGIASAIPATLVLFFIRDALGLEAWSGTLLALYFVAAAASLPVWLGLIRRFGLVRCWLLAMALAIIVFIWAALLPGSGHALPGFVAVTLLSGAALGADLTIPGALLARCTHASGGGADGAYFGLWNFATKLNLALAAGMALPLLGLFGYQPGVTEPRALQALTLAYCVVPCGLKLFALLLLWRVHPAFSREIR